MGMLLAMSAQRHAARWHVKSPRITAVPIVICHKSFSEGWLASCAMFVCILFFELPVLTASIIGASVGTTYVLLCVGISVCRRWRRTRQERHDNNAGSWQDTSQAPLLGGGQGQVLPV